MPHIDEMTRPRNLKPSDLGAHGELDLTIEEVRQEDLGSDDGTVALRWVCYFQERDRGLVLNNTTVAALAELCGSQVSEDWTGKRVRLYTTTAPWRGEQVPVVRIKAAQP